MVFHSTHHAPPHCAPCLAHTQAGRQPPLNAVLVLRFASGAHPEPESCLLSSLHPSCLAHMLSCPPGAAAAALTSMDIGHANRVLPSRDAVPLQGGRAMRAMISGRKCSAAM